MVEMRKWQMAAAVLTVALCMGSFGFTAFAAMPETLVPVGHTVGIQLCTDGVLVTGLSMVNSGGRQLSPARTAGLRTGDIIVTLAGEKAVSAEQVSEQIRNSDGQKLSCTISRDGREKQLTVQAVADDSGQYRLGAYLRSSVAGIGTVTFYDPDSGMIGALGHGITDADTDRLIPLASGILLPSTVKAVKKGEKGDPGELRGNFVPEEELGTLMSNTDCGIFGRADSGSLPLYRAALPTAKATELHPGKATILSNVAGDTVEEYEVEIEKVITAAPQRNLVLHVSDPALLKATGGIVQGMSGSPILQDGKLVGAVTHVFVNDPTRGYGISVERMFAEAEKTQLATAS